MRKTLRLLILVFVLAAIVASSFIACNKKNEEKEDNGIVITFVTGFETAEDPIIIAPRQSTLEKPAVMPEDPWRMGYTFLGWYYDKEGTRAFSTKDGLKSDVTLYAKWNKNPTNSVDLPDPIVEAQNGLRYLPKEDGTYKVVGYVGEATELIMSPVYEKSRVTEIGSKAFDGNDTLRKITVASSVSVIEDGAFNGCSSLAEIEAVAANTVFSSQDGVLYAAGKTELVAVGKGRTKDLTLLDKTAKIRPYALAGCGCKVKATENSAMTVIPELAFAEFCGRAELSSAVKEIRRKAFCDATGEIVFPSDCGIEKLWMGEFDGYKGEKLVLPGSVTSISGSPFNGMTAELDFTATGIKNIGETAFWGYAGKELVIPYFVETLGRNCFSFCKATVTFDDRTEYAVVKENTFNQFAGKVILPASVIKVEAYAFYAMKEGSAYFSSPKSAINIDAKAFYECPAENGVPKNVHFTGQQ